MKSLYIISFIYLTVVQATKVSFKLIAPDAKSQVHVKIDNVFTQLNAQDPDIPYYTGSAELDYGQNYTYVVDGVSESFERVIVGFSTKNEFFGRPVTYANNIPELPSILAEGSWTRGGDTQDPIWDSNYIPSIFVTGLPQEMNQLIENVPKSTFKTKITFIGPETIHTFEDCTFGLHKPGRKNNDSKQSWIWSLPQGQFMAHRNWFKLRHMEEDPTQQREKLYADILRKMGTYANEANMVRFFINKEGMGTFNMLDDVIMYSYINAMFYNGQTPEQLGGLFDGASGASFGFPSDFDSFIPNYESPLDQDSLVPFAKTFKSVNFSEENQVRAIGDYFDYDQFLRFMVMEFLTGDWDGYWQEQTNDGAYIDLGENNKVYYLGQDFDGTFGVNLQQDRSFVSLPYTDYPKRFPGGVLINQLLKSSMIKARFENYLKTTVLEIFNREVLGDYLEARYQFLAPDLEWDRSIKQRSPGNNFGWTFDQIYQNLFEPVYGKGKNSGGADWGLLEWVAAKESAVKKFFHIVEIPVKMGPGKVVSEDSSPEKVQEKVPKKVQDKVPKKVQDKVQENVSEKVQDKVQENVSEKIQEKVQENISEKVQEKVQEKAKGQELNKPMSIAGSLAKTTSANTPSSIVSSKASHTPVSSSRAKSSSLPSASEEISKVIDQPEISSATKTDIPFLFAFIALFISWV